MGIIFQMRNIRPHQLMASYVELNILLTAAEGQAFPVGAYLLEHGSWEAWTLYA